MEVDVNDVIKFLSEEISKKSVDLAMSKAQIVKLKKSYRRSTRNSGSLCLNLANQTMRATLEGPSSTQKTQTTT